MNYLSGVGLYVFLILILYGRKEVLPKNIYKAFDADAYLKAPKRAKGSKALSYAAEILKQEKAQGVASVYQLGQALKRQ